MRALLLAAVLLLGGCTVDARAGASTCPARQELHDHPYVDGGDDLQRLDLYQPDGAACDDLVPLVIWVHGGAWRGGDKARDIGPKVDLWTARGWAVASVDYRLTDPDDPLDERVMAPAHDEDVAAAVAWLLDHAVEVGLDGRRVALLGHSAGGGIVAALAADPAYLGAHGLAPTALSCVGILDAEGLDVRRAIDEPGELAHVYPPVFGPDRAAWDDMSPFTHVGDAPVPPLFLVTRDRPDHEAIVRAFAGRTRAVGGTATVLQLPSFSHGDVNVRIGDATDDKLTPALEAFLGRCLPSEVG